MAMAMSIGWPMIPRGEPAARTETAAARRSSLIVPSGSVQLRWVIGVSVNPGATALTRTPLGPSSAAATRVSWITPALVMA